MTGDFVAKRSRPHVAAIVCWLLLLSALPADLVGAEEVAPAKDCAAVSRELAEANSNLTGELRQIKRELAALRQEMAEPGVREVMAGVGYILGLCGVAFFLSARKKEK